MYLDASAILKLYLDEADRDACLALIADDRQPTTVSLTSIEVRRRLALAGDGDGAARAAFLKDWELMRIVLLDDALVERAASIAELTAARPLDAIHLSAAERCGLPLLTYDRRQSEAAAALGLAIVAT